MMRKIILTILVSCTSLLMLLLVSCTNKDFEYIQSDEYIQSESANIYIDGNKDYDTIFKVVLDTDSKIESKKKVLIHYGLYYRINLNMSSDDDYYNQSVVLELCRYCVKNNELVNYKTLVQYEGKLIDFLDYNFLYFDNKYEDSISVEDLDVSYKDSKDYGAIYYDLKIKSLDSTNVFNSFIINGKNEIMWYGAVLFYEIQNDNQISFLTSNPEPVEIKHDIKI